MLLVGGKERESRTAVAARTVHAAVSDVNSELDDRKEEVAPIRRKSRSGDH
jgi:hypothetical protein